MAVGDRKVRPALVHLAKVHAGNTLTSCTSVGVHAGAQTFDLGAQELNGH